LWQSLFLDVLILQSVASPVGFLFIEVGYNPSRDEPAYEYPRRIDRLWGALQRSSFSVGRREILVAQSEEWLHNRSGYAVFGSDGRV
jgi:hypothetical protein